MAQTVTINIAVNDQGGVVVKRMGDDFKRAAQDIERNTRGSFSRMNADVGRELDEMTSKMVRWGTLAVTVFGGLALRAVANLGIEFGRRMSAVKAFTEATGTQFDALRKQALDLGQATIFTATNAAEAMEQLGLAGFKTTEILQVMPDVLNLAAAGSLEMASAAEIASNIIRQMGLHTTELGRAVDVLAFTAAESTTTVQELGVAFSYSGNLARNLGLKVEDVAAALGVLANQGLEGERAGTGLVRIMSIFLGNLEEGEKGLAKFNLKLFDQAGHFVGLADAMRQMQAAGITTQDVMESFGQRGGPTMLALMNAGADATDKFRASLANAGGFAAQVAKTLRDNLGGDVEQLTGSLQTLALDLFEKVTPALRSVTTSATGLVTAWTEMLRGSDVASGLSRALTALALTMGVVALNAARRLGVQMATLAVQLLAAASGATAVDIALLKSLPVMEAWSLASGRMKLAALGFAAAVGVIAYQATRAIMELTGLDSKVEGFFENLLSKAGDGPQTLVRLNESLGLIQRTVTKLNAEGLDVKVDPAVLDGARKAIAMVQEKVDKGIRIEVDPGQLFSTLDKTSGEVREILSLSRELGPKFTAIWAEAGKGATTLEERLTRVKDLIGGIKPPKPLGPGTGEDPEKHARAVRELEKNLLEIGHVSATGMAQIEEDFGRLGRIAKAQNVPMAEFASAFRDELLGIGVAAEQSGQKVSPFLEDLIDKARKVPPVKLEVHADVHAIDNLNEMLNRTGLGSTRAAEAFVRDFARMKSAAASAGEPTDSVLRSMADSAFDLQAQFERAGKDIPEALRGILREVQPFRQLSFDTQVWDSIRERMVALKSTSDETFRSLITGFERMAEDAGKSGISLADVVRSNREEILALARGAEASGKPIDGLFKQMVDMAREMDNIDLRRDAWMGLRDDLLAVGVVAQDTADALMRNLDTAVQAAAEHGVSATDVYRAHREELQRLVEAYMVAGQEIPLAIQEAFDGSRIGEFMNGIRQSAAEFVLNVTKSWSEFVGQAEQSFAHMVGQFAVFGGSLAQISKNLLKQLAAQAITMLVQWGLAKIALGKVNHAVATSEASTNLASGLAQTFVNSFASAAAIPFVGWAMAPGVAAANLALAASGAAGAAALGAGLGAGIGVAGFAAEGALITRGPTPVMTGERGAEAIVPLTGEPARRAAKAMGIGQGGDGVTLHAHFTGDNWRDGGIADELLEKIYDGITGMIRRGKLAAFPAA